jgi:hypothetical protein
VAVQEQVWALAIPQSQCMVPTIRSGESCSKVGLRSQRHFNTFWLSWLANPLGTPPAQHGGDRHGAGTGVVRSSAGFRSFYRLVLGPRGDRMPHRRMVTPVFHVERIRRHRLISWLPDLLKPVTRLPL